MAHRVSDRTTLVGMTHDISSIDIPHEYVICLDHVGIAVPDLDAAVEFYRSNFGWVNHDQETNEEARRTLVPPMAWCSSSLR